MAGTNWRMVFYLPPSPIFPTPKFSCVRQIRSSPSWKIFYHGIHNTLLDQITMKYFSLYWMSYSGLLECMYLHNVSKLLAYIETKSRAFVICLTIIYYLLYKAEKPSVRPSICLPVTPISQPCQHWLKLDLLEMKAESSGTLEYIFIHLNMPDECTKGSGVSQNSH